MTNREYHADPAISKSDLDQIHRSPLHWQYRKAHPPEQTPTLLVGSAVHKMILEPSGFADEFAVAPETDRRTRVGREAYQAFQESAAGKTVITPELYQLCTDMAEALHHCQTARQLLTGGRAEQSFFWDDARTGIRCKCRPDYLRDGFCVDYKTTQDASPEAFQKAAYRYRYPVQAYWYLHGLGKNGLSGLDFVFIAQEKEPPYAAAVYYADELFLQLGQQEAAADLETLAKCRSTGIYSGYPEEILPLTPPKFALRDLM